tara:strand:- start:539 stop:877 length:339 start_codon:yes stop_codon:yes gene_type:complete
MLFLMQKTIKSIMKKLDKLTYELAKNCLSKNSNVEAKLFLNWDKIFIKYIDIIKPLRINFFSNKSKNGILILRVKRGFELEVQMEQIKILNLANNYIGYKAIERIKISNEGF